MSKLEKIFMGTGTLEVVTGLRIGGTKSSLDIGGMEKENPIIRHPLTNLPYIPGSSLKGKMRCLLEQKQGKHNSKGGPCDCGNCEICSLFGAMKSKTPTRLIVRDAFLTKEWEERWAKSKDDLAEIKSETAIDRRSGAALPHSLRTQERIPPGVKFNIELILRIFEHDDPNKYQKMINTALELLQKDYLGSSGTRGYGKIKIENFKFEEIQYTK